MSTSKKSCRLALAMALALAAPSAAWAEAAGDQDEPAAEARPGLRPLSWGDANRAFHIRAVAELGFLAVASHKIQFSRSGTYFDYRTEGGQDTLFLVGRLSAELRLFRHHEIVFLYQPLSIQTSSLLQEDFLVDDELFPAGEPIDLLYNFPFYRLSYMYDIFDDRRLEVAVGVSLQIRNATISFQSGDGELYRTNRDVGIVPLLKLRVMYQFDNGFWLGTEIDGIYAPVSYLNGDDNDVVGALLDASLRAGLDLPRGVQAFLNLRYLGGGATGQSDDDEGPGDGYVRNWLHFITVTLGVNWDIL